MPWCNCRTRDVLGVQAALVVVDPSFTWKPEVNHMMFFVAAASSFCGDVDSTHDSLLPLSS